MYCASRTAGCPSAERKVLTAPTGGASPRFAPQGVESPFAQSRQPGRAVFLKRRRKERDDFLGREGQPSQSPSRKGRRQTLYSCLVRPAVDTSFLKDSLAPVSRASSNNAQEKNWIIQSRSGVRPLDFLDHIAVRPHSRPLGLCRPGLAFQCPLQTMEELLAQFQSGATKLL
jgi:hypothetical protein